MNEMPWYVSLMLGLAAAAFAIGVWATITHADITIHNDEADPNHTLIYNIFVEPVCEGTWASADGYLDITLDAIGDRAWIWLIADGGPPDVVALHPWEIPDADCARVISSWGTLPESTDLHRARQRGLRITYVGDYEFDPDIVFFSIGVWADRGPHGAWPPHLASAAAYRLEVEVAGGGNGQVNIASPCIEGTQELPSMGFRTQARGESPVSSPLSLDDTWIELQDPDSVCVRSTGLATVISSGWAIRGDLTIDAILDMLAEL